MYNSVVIWFQSINKRGVHSPDISLYQYYSWINFNTSDRYSKASNNVSVFHLNNDNEWISYTVIEDYKLMPSSNSIRKRRELTSGVERYLQYPWLMQIFHGTDKLMRRFYGRRCVLKPPAPVLRFDTISAPVCDRDFRGIIDRGKEDDTINYS